MSHIQQIKDLNDIGDKYLYAEIFGKRIEEKNGQITWLLEDGGKYTLNWEGEQIEQDVRFFDED